MTLISISYPVLLLSLACVGYGVPGMMLLCRGFAKLPIAFRLVAAYFLGQSLLAAVFVVLAFCHWFTRAAVFGMVIPGFLVGTASFWYYRSELRSAVAEAAGAWRRAPLPWRAITVLAACLYLYGFSTMGRRGLEVDATAFYLAAAKLIAHTGQMSTLPGYEYFSWVIMTGEMLYASLMLLGSPGTGARFYEWINFFPALVAMYFAARICGLTARAAFLAGLMMLTSSAAIALWGGGKTDTFAVGPALIGVWFALASWKPEHRWNSMALSGLFSGFAIATKFTYLIPLLPGVMLLTHWQAMGAAIDDIKAMAWKRLLLRTGQMALSGLWFLGLVALGLSVFLIKNYILFHSPTGYGAALASSSKWYTDRTILRLMLSYPIALTYGRYWAQLGTMSPLILAFIPLLFLMPRDQRRLSTPLAAVTISTVIAVAIWMALMPSIFMPRYILATLLLLAIPAAAGAAYVSRERTTLAGAVVLATTLTLIFMPSHVMTRARIFSPGRAIDYFLNGDEERAFTSDPTVSATFEVNRFAGANDRVLLLIYPRIWLRNDLLAATSTSTEMSRAMELLAKRSPDFWNYVEGQKFRFLIADTSQLENLEAVAKSKPNGFGFCQLKFIDGVAAFQVGKGCFECPPGRRTNLRGPFAKPWADGNAYIAEVPELEAESDSAAYPYRSPMALCEDGKPLWHSHSVHQEIRTEGNGRFSHWGRQLQFSASDNSDPNANGRTYVLVHPDNNKAQ
jgi:hypothetical protein